MPGRRPPWEPCFLPPAARAGAELRRPAASGWPDLQRDQARLSRPALQSPVHPEGSEAALLGGVRSSEPTPCLPQTSMTCEADTACDIEAGPLSITSLGAAFFGLRFRAALPQTASSIGVMCDHLWTIGGRIAGASSHVP